MTPPSQNKRELRLSGIVDSYGGGLLDAGPRIGGTDVIGAMQDQGWTLRGDEKPQVKVFLGVEPIAEGELWASHGFGGTDVTPPEMPEIMVGGVDLFRRLDDLDGREVLQGPGLLMGQYIAKLADDAYVNWSTVVDGPISWVLARDEAVKRYGEARVARADRNGTSIVDGYPAGSTPTEIVAGNRAGEGESELTVEEIIAQYSPEDPSAWERPNG